MSDDDGDGAVSMCLVFHSVLLFITLSASHDGHHTKSTGRTGLPGLAAVVIRLVMVDGMDTLDGARPTDVGSV